MERMRNAECSMTQKLTVFVHQAILEIHTIPKVRVVSRVFNAETLRIVRLPRNVLTEGVWIPADHTKSNAGNTRVVALGKITSPDVFATLAQLEIPTGHVNL